MVRNAFGAVISFVLLGGVLTGWWFAAGQDFGVMFEQAKGLIFWVGHKLAPLFTMLFNSTEGAA